MIYWLLWASDFLSCFYFLLEEWWERVCSRTSCQTRFQGKIQKHNVSVKNLAAEKEQRTRERITIHTVRTESTKIREHNLFAEAIKEQRSALNLPFYPTDAIFVRRC